MTQYELEQKYGTRIARSRLRMYNDSKEAIQIMNEELYGGDYFCPEYLQIDRILDINEENKYFIK